MQLDILCGEESTILYSRGTLTVNSVRHVQYFIYCVKPLKCAGGTPYSGDADVNPLKNGCVLTILSKNNSKQNMASLFSIHVQHTSGLRFPCALNDNHGKFKIIPRARLGYEVS